MSKKLHQSILFASYISFSVSFRAGDCLLGIDDTDLLGLKIKDIAALIRTEEDIRNINFSVWRYMQENEEQNYTGLALKGPLPNVANNLASALSGTVCIHYLLY
jgi:hypothetical protein